MPKVLEEARRKASALTHPVNVLQFAVARMTPDIVMQLDLDSVWKIWLSKSLLCTHSDVSP